MCTMDIIIGLLFLCFPSIYTYEDVTVWEYVSTSEDFLLLAKLIEDANMADILTHTGPYTLFAPDDSAFEKLEGNGIADYSPTQLKSIVQYHIVPGFILVPMAPSPTNFTTLLDEQIVVAPERASLMVNNEARVRDAFKDTIVNNGVVQKLNSVLLPPSKYLSAETIAQIILKDDVQFKNMFLALMMAGMINLLESNEFTVFAPTDQAFNNYMDHLLDLTNPDNTDLFQKVLKYHILPGVHSAESLKDSEFFTLHGLKVRISGTESGLAVEEANIVESDIFAANGFIHAIDKVLTPHDLNDLVA